MNDGENDEDATSASVDGSKRGGFEIEYVGMEETVMSGSNRVRIVY